MGETLLHRATSWIPGSKLGFFVFLFSMLALVPYVRLLDLWQVSIAFILLVLYALTENDTIGTATVWFTTAVVLHNVWYFLFLVLYFQTGINLLPH